MVIVGRVKIPYNDFFILSRNEREAIIEGHENDIRNDWERTRFGAYLSILPHISSKEQKTLTPEKLWKLPWETTSKKSEITKDDFEHARKLAEIVKSGKFKLRDNNGKS